MTSYIIWTPLALMVIAGVLHGLLVLSSKRYRDWFRNRLLGNN